MSTGTTRVEVRFTLTDEERQALRMGLYGKDGPIPEEDFQKWVQEKIYPRISEEILKWRTRVQVGGPI